MFITLVAVVIALVLGHVAPGWTKALRRHEWYGHWLRWLGRPEHAGGTSLWRGRYAIALAVLPILLPIALLQWWLDGPWLGWLGLLFDVAVLVYAWGPRDLDVDVENVLDSHDPTSRAAAIAGLWPPGAEPRGDGPSLVGAVFDGALTRWFAVLFWFLLLGPFGAVLYRLVERSAGEFAGVLSEAGTAGARTLRAALEWPVAQLMTLGMALVGNFDVVRDAWRSSGGDHFSLDGGFLVAAARASVKSELAEEAAEYAEEGIPPVLRELPELRDAMSLVWRILLLWLAVLAVFVIGGWVS
jgi:AmpE protein